MGSPHANPPAPIETNWTPLKNKISSHCTQPFSSDVPDPHNWKVKNGFRTVLRRGISTPLLKKNLEQLLFLDTVLKAAFPGYDFTDFTLDSIVSCLANERLDLPNLQGCDREVQWVNYFNKIADAVKGFTSIKAKHCWTAAYSNTPIPNSTMARKPDMALVPKEVQDLKDIGWSMICSAGEEKKHPHEMSSKADDSLENVSSLHIKVSIPEMILMVPRTRSKPWTVLSSCLGTSSIDDTFSASLLRGRPYVSLSLTGRVCFMATFSMP